MSQRYDENGKSAAFGFESKESINFPSYVMFDVTNKCNAKCRHCPQAVGFGGMDNWQFLSIDIFKSVIDQCIGKEVDFFRITGDGEPLLHPEIWNMLKYPSLVGVGPVGLTTNGSALTPKNIEKLLAANIFMVDVSLDGASQETFEKIRVGLSYKKTVENVRRLIKRRNETGSAMKIAVSFVEQEPNVHETEDFLSMWEGQVDEVIIRKMISNVGKNVIELSDNAEKHNIDRYPCPHVFRRIVVNYDGRFKVCPIDWEAKLVSGTVQVPISDIWKNEYYSDLRRQHLENDFRENCICKDCKDWLGTPWTMGYEKIIKRMSSI